MVESRNGFVFCATAAAQHEGQTTDNRPCGERNKRRVGFPFHPLALYNAIRAKLFLLARWVAYICSMAQRKLPLWTKKWLHKYRVVLVDTQSFEERFSLNLSALNVFIVVGSSAITLVLLTLVLIAYTPLREYIPGYASTQLRRTAVTLAAKTDSLESVLAQQTAVWSTLEAILQGTLPIDSLDPNPPASVVASFEKLKPSKVEKSFIETVQASEKFSLSPSQKVAASLSYTAPVQGTLLRGFAPGQNHWGVDIAAAEGTAVKACLDGVVIYSDWSPAMGYTVCLQHAHDLVSYYSNASAVLKRRGARVRAGEAIALLGRGFEGPSAHVHFELWSGGKAINPVHSISF